MGLSAWIGSFKSICISKHFKNKGCSNGKMNAYRFGKDQGNSMKSANTQRNLIEIATFRNGQFQIRDFGLRCWISGPPEQNSQNQTICKIRCRYNRKRVSERAATAVPARSSRSEARRQGSARHAAPRGDQAIGPNLSQRCSMYAC